MNQIWKTKSLTATPSTGTLSEKSKINTAPPSFPILASAYNRNTARPYNGSQKDIFPVPEANSFGGVKIDEDDVCLTFDLLDTPQDPGVATRVNIRQKLPEVFSGMRLQDFDTIMGGSEDHITIQDVWKLVSNNDIHHFDPVAEVFKTLDPRDTGFINVDLVAQMLGVFKMDEISDEERTLIIKYADLDEDGKISLSDFRQMLDVNRLPSLEDVVYTREDMEEDLLELQREYQQENLHYDDDRERIQRRPPTGKTGKSRPSSALQAKDRLRPGIWK